MLHLVELTPGSPNNDPETQPDARAGIEAARLDATERYGILDTVPEPAFDHITALAADIFSVPIAILGFIGTNHVFFKSHHGLDATQASRWRRSGGAGHGRHGCALNSGTASMPACRCTVPTGTRSARCA